MQENEQIVRAGTPLMQIGDPSNLEVVADVLSRDAVRVSVGDLAYIERWGGDRPLAAIVKRIEPSGFAKVSALGISEQHVKVVLDIKDDHEIWKRLGHDFQVVVRIVVWQAANELQVPVSALFRRGKEWAVFVVADNSARLTRITIGARNRTHAAVISGISSDQSVILFPSDKIVDGTSVSSLHNVPKGQSINK